MDGRFLRLQFGADDQAARQSDKTDDLSDRASGTPEPAVLSETVKTESDTTPLKHDESSNGGRSGENHPFFKNLLGSATTMFFYSGIQGFAVVLLFLKCFAKSWRAPAGLSQPDRE